MEGLTVLAPPEPVSMQQCKSPLLGFMASQDTRTGGGCWPPPVARVELDVILVFFSP